MNLTFQNCPDVFKLKNQLTNFPARVRAFLKTTIALILAMTLIYGCAKESEDLDKLREENRALKEKVS